MQRSHTYKNTLCTIIKYVEMQIYNVSAHQMRKTGMGQNAYTSLSKATPKTYTSFPPLFD